MLNELSSCVKYHKIKNISMGSSDGPHFIALIALAEDPSSDLSTHTVPGDITSSSGLCGVLVHAWHILTETYT